MLETIVSKNILEFIAVATAIIYVVMATKIKKSCFVFGLISSAIYSYLCFQLKFYFDFGINLFYVALSIYGWITWTSANNVELEAKKIPKKLLLLGIVFSGIICFLLAHFADRFSDASWPYLDSFTSLFAILASWMLVKKYIENWLIWIVVDLVASAMYLMKGLHLTSLLFIIYTIIAIFGYLEWKKKLNVQ